MARVYDGVKGCVVCGGAHALRDGGCVGCSQRIMILLRQGQSPAQIGFIRPEIVELAECVAKKWDGVRDAPEARKNYEAERGRDPNQA